MERPDFATDRGDSASASSGRLYIRTALRHEFGVDELVQGNSADQAIKVSLFEGQAGRLAFREFDAYRRPRDPATEETFTPTAMPGRCRCARWSNPPQQPATISMTVLRRHASASSPAREKDSG